MSQFFVRIRWPKYWSFSFSISPSNEYSGLISFRMDWLNLLAVQGTLKSLLQHHSKTSGFLSRETGISGNFVGRIKGAKCPFDLQFLTWDFS